VMRGVPVNKFPGNKDTGDLIRTVKAPGGTVLF
jgi:hypothetical protein